ncbi:uncharacterized protein EKO05_0004750 [Ascochyta rabiei]|uniref:uncharacterized protein n=1 Tax=Didymella rabiei TaxID=5454 RepID=UPI00220D2870|nr:uncharacterized protein EKO05_0004750 [Ascochyta rabiei]UPX14261.1 hypothetical protein EKO05_0004750 [Ascochyta rabiei]
MSGLLGTASKSVPYTSTEPIEGDEPSKANSDPGYLGEDEGQKQIPRQPAKTSHSMQSFSSDADVRNWMRDEDSKAKSASSLTPSSSLNACLRPSQSKIHPSSSMLQTKTDLHLKASANAYTTKCQWLMAKLSNISEERTRPKIGGSSSLRSNSDPIVREAPELSNKTDLDKPLKTCLKQRAQSADTTPPSEPVTGTISSNKAQRLRRVKTVDFEDSVLEHVPSRAGSSSKTRKHGKTRPDKVSERSPLCPGRISLTRPLPACPAVTRTDVHVISISPILSKSASLGPGQSKGNREADPATPTMQIVESSNGSYEVIWDDVPPEHNERMRRHDSSVSQALEALSYTATDSLERVNTKLNEWSDTWNAPSDCFKPTIVVFPDDDGRRPPYECAIVDDEDIEIFAPPNSERASAVHSQHPSRPVSAPTSRAVSQDWFISTADPQDTPLDTSYFATEQILAMPDSDAWSAHLVAARRKLGASSPERKLSNVDEAETKFRNHRDSVTIAHSRLIRSGGVGPELFAHSDSVSLAKKRIHARNLTSSAS